MLTNNQIRMINNFANEIGIANFRILTEQNEYGDLLKVTAIWEVPTDEMEELKVTTQKTIKEYHE